MRDAMAYLERLIFSIIKKHGAASVCDYGCGDGNLLKTLHKRWPELTLCGIDNFSLWPENRRPAAEGIEFVDRNSRRFAGLGWKRQFDLVISTFALHHFRYPVTELRKMEGLLSGKGLIFIADMEFRNRNESETAKNIAAFADEMFAAFTGAYHRHAYTLDEAKDIVSALDSAVIESRSVRWSLPLRVRKSDAARTLAHLGHRRARLSKLKSPVLRKFLDANLRMVKKAVATHCVDYSSIFHILARRGHPGAHGD